MRARYRQRMHRPQAWKDFESLNQSLDRLGNLGTGFTRQITRRYNVRVSNRTRTYLNGWLLQHQADAAIDPSRLPSIHVNEREMHPASSTDGYLRHQEYRPLLLDNLKTFLFS